MSEKIRSVSKKVAKKGVPVPVQNFFEAIGQDELIKALEVSKSESMVKLCKALTQPAPGRTFLGMCEQYDISIHDLVEAFRSYQQAEGIIRMMRHVPQVMEDVALDAKSHDEVCPRCDGKQEVIDGKTKEGKEIKRTCPLCRGKGEIRIVGDKVARDLVFDAIGEKKAKGPQVAIQQNFTSLDDMLKLSQKVISQ